MTTPHSLRIQFSYAVKLNSNSKSLNNIEEYIKSNQIKSNSLIPEYSTLKACLMASFDWYALHDDTMFLNAEKVDKDKIEQEIERINEYLENKY